MTLDEINSMMSVDSIIDKHNLDDESVKIPSLHFKYYRIYVQESFKLSKAQLDLDKLKKFKSEYYTGKCESSVYEDKPLQFRVAKADLDDYIDSDEDIQTLKLKIASQKLKCDLLIDFIKMLSNRGFHIKNVIDAMKFKSGGF